MNTLRNVGTDEQLTTEQGLAVRENAVMAARRAFVGRKLFGGSIRKIDSGAQTYGYDTLTEVSSAAFDYSWPGRLSLDAINLARSTVPIPVLHKEWEINKLDLAASRMTGAPLNTSTSDSAAYKVAYLEDTNLIYGYTADGGTTYEVNGLYKAAGNTDATNYDFGTAANIITAINSGIALLLDDNIQPPYNFVCNPTQYAQLLPLIANTAVSYRQWVEQSLMGGSIFPTSAMAESDSMLLAANPEGKFEYVLAEDFTTETEITNVKAGSNLFGRHYIRGLPVVYDGNAICTLSTV